MDSSDEDEAAFIDAFFLPGGILDPEDEEKAKRSEQQETKPSALFPPPSAADTWLGAAAATSTLPSAEVPHTTSSETSSSWLGQNLGLSTREEEPLLSGKETTFNTDAPPYIPSTVLPLATQTENASDLVGFSNLAPSGAPKAAPAVQNLTGLETSTDKSAAAWSQSQWNSGKLSSSAAILSSSNQEPLGTGTNINLAAPTTNPPPPPGFDSPPPGFEQVPPQLATGENRDNAAAGKSSKASAVPSKPIDSKAEQPQPSKNFKRREQKAKSNQSNDTFQSVSRGRSKAESNKVDKSREQEGTPKRPKNNNKKKSRQTRNQENLLAFNGESKVTSGSTEEIMHIGEEVKSSFGLDDKSKDEGSTETLLAKAPMRKKNQKTRGRSKEPLDDDFAVMVGEESVPQSDPLAEKAIAKTNPEENQHHETKGSEKGTIKRKEGLQKAKDSKVSKPRQAIVKKKENAKESEDTKTSQNQNASNDMDTIVNIFAPAVNSMLDIVQSIYSLLNQMYTWITEILIPALKQSALTGTSSALHSLRGIFLLLFAAFHTYSFAADETLAELNLESAWIPYVALVYAPTAARHLMNFVDLPQFTPHLVSSAVLCFLFRRPAGTTNSKNFSSKATPDDLRNIVLFCCQLLVPIDLLVDGFASVNTGIMTLCYADRLLLAYAICVVRKGWILAPCAWISFAIQFLVASYFPWRHILAEPILLFVLFSIGMASLNILRNLEQLKQRAKKALGKN